MFIRPGRRIKFIDKSIDFHSQKHWLGHLALDESSASDFYIRKELGLDPGWDLKDLTIDCSLLLVPWRAVRELYAVSGSCQGPRPLWCCWNVGHRIPLHLCQSSQLWSVFTAVTCHLVILSFPFSHANKGETLWMTETCRDFLGSDLPGQEFGSCCV